MEQLPAMAEELARAAKPGRSVENAFRIVAADTAAPLGDELRLAARRSDMGLDLASAVRDLPERTGVMTMTMFTSAISLHQDTGGDLIQVLERLSTAVRDRLHFTARLRAATIASRLGTWLMVLVPVVVLLFYGLRDPGYFSQLLSSFWGRLSLGIAILLQATGCVLAWQILKRSARF
jgi:tight adherence protein B